MIRLFFFSAWGMTTLYVNNFFFFVLEVNTILKFPVSFEHNWKLKEKYINTLIEILKIYNGSRAIVVGIFAYPIATCNNYNLKINIQIVSLLVTIGFGESIERIVIICRDVVSKMKKKLFWSQTFVDALLIDSQNWDNQPSVFRVAAFD